MFGPSSSTVNKSLAVCPLYLLYKDHKGWTKEAGGLAPTRPVASANSGMNMHFSELVSQVLEPVANMWEGGLEVISTDDFISNLDRLNERTRGKRTGCAAERDVEKEVSSNIMRTTALVRTKAWQQIVTV